MTPEEFDAWMLDTSDAPKPGDPIPEDNNNKGSSEGSNQLKSLLPSHYNCSIDLLIIHMWYSYSL